MTPDLTAVTAGCVICSALGHTSPMGFLDHTAVDADIAVFARMLAVMSTWQWCLADGWAGEVDVQWRFVASNLDFVITVLHDLVDQGSTTNFIRILCFVAS
jgi:hypothetical protein